MGSDPYPATAPVEALKTARMPKHTDTYARAYEACGAVFTERARFPTIELIRERIGVNSPTVIKRAITDWTLAFAEQARERRARPDLPAALLDAADSLWALALREARAQFDGDRQAWAAERTELEARLATAEQNLASLAQDFAAYRTAHTAERDTQAQALAQRDQQLDAESAGRAVAEQALAALRVEHGVLAATLEVERTQFAQRHQEWEARFEGEHRWHLQRIAEEQSRLERTQQRELAKRDSELVRLTLERDQLETRGRLLEAQQAEAQGRRTALEEQLAVSRESLAEKDRTLVALQAQLATLTAAGPRPRPSKPRAR